MWQRLRKDQKGFTLIELVVVVAILGILAVIVTPKVMGALDNAKKNSVSSSSKQIQVAMERISAETGAYPTFAGLCGSGTAPTCDLTTLVGALNQYVNLNSADFASTGTQSYVLTAASGSTPATYTLTLTFASGKVATIKPDIISVN